VCCNLMKCRIRYKAGTIATRVGHPQEEMPYLLEAHPAVHMRKEPYTTSKEPYTPKSLICLIYLGALHVSVNYNNFNS
jgi:hypothetical protein